MLRPVRNLWRLLGWSLGTLAFSFAIPAAAQTPGIEADGTLPVRHAARPLTLIDGLFRLDFVAGGGLIDRTDAAVQLVAGAGYGVSDNFEVGIVLIDAIVSPNRDSGLQEPGGYLRYRFVDGSLQAAAEVFGQAPTDGRLAFAAAAPTLVSVADRLRFDLRPQIEAAQRDEWVVSWRAEGALSVQIADQLRAYAGGVVRDGVAGPVRPLLQLTGGLAFTFVDGPQPIGDLELRVQSRAWRLGDDETPVPQNLDGDWFAVLAYRPFIRSQPARSSDPFADPEAW